MATSDLDPTRGDLRDAAAPGRKAGGAFAQRALSRRRAGGNSKNYPGVSVGLIQDPASRLFGERVRYV